MVSQQVKKRLIARTVGEFRAPHHGDVDGVGGADGDEGHEAADERRQRLDGRVQPERRGQRAARRRQVRGDQRALRDLRVSGPE